MLNKSYKNDVIVLVYPVKACNKCIYTHFIPNIIIKKCSSWALC